MARPLPPGQHARPDFPRFGLPQYADRFPSDPDRIMITIAGDVAEPGTIDARDLDAVPRVDQISDFHCVTTWSRRGLEWSGVTFRDLYRDVIAPSMKPDPDSRFVVLRAQDGYRASLPLEDLLAPDVLVVDRLDGDPLDVPHGAPVRLIAPRHYGYKNVKHLSAIEFHRETPPYRMAGYRFMEHPRARVHHEERARGIPGWVCRFVYRPLIGRTARQFRVAWDRHQRVAPR